MKWAAEGGKELFWVGIRKALCERNAFGLQKSWRFLLMQSNPIKKSFFQHTKISTFHRTKANVQQPFLNTACYCELAVQQFFFEKYQSCVSCTVTLSHRFKAFSPAFCGQNRFRYEPPESFCKLTSGRALNRPRSPEVRKPLVYFWFFSYTRKARKTSPFAGNSEVLQTSNQPTAVTSSHRNN